jgi:hypothetical protein
VKRVRPIGNFVGAGVATLVDAGFLANDEVPRERSSSGFRIAPSIVARPGGVSLGVDGEF